MVGTYPFQIRLSDYFAGAYDNSRREKPIVFKFGMWSYFLLSLIKLMWKFLPENSISHLFPLS